MSNKNEPLAAVFNEWAKRYAENPDAFGPILDADGKPTTDYGEQCAAYFDQVAQDIGVTYIFMAVKASAIGKV